MSPTQPPDYPPLQTGEVYGPMSPAMRGGVNDGHDGVTYGPNGMPSDPADQEAPPANMFAGMGEILEAPDADVFKETDEMIRRQELLALNHLHQDNHYSYVVGGYPWSTLTHDQTRDVYEQTLPYGVSVTSIQAVPNKALDLVNKASEQILVDLPTAYCEPVDDSEEAEAAADMANRFLEQDAGEQGTNDAVLFDDRVKLAMSCASTYVEVWSDPTGGGYVPLQIEAHPEAVSPDNPLIGPDGMPTTDPVLRYVTAPTGGQFTPNASDAAPQWQPKLRASKWQREHIRVYPEHLPVELCGQIIILAHSTIGEMKRRSDIVAKMAPEDLSALCDWTPPRYQVLLPPFQRARWKLSDGKDKNKGGSSDERIMFYYHRYIKSNPDYRKGADVMVTGALDCLVLSKKLLSADVTVTKGGTASRETRCREIPVVQVTPRGDPRGQDPSGRAYVELFVGATENTAFLTQSYSEALNDSIHTPFAIPATSPISGEMVRNARSTGDMLLMKVPGDVPFQLPPPKLPGDFFAFYEKMDEATNSIASQERAAQGADTSKERSGTAIRLAVSQNNIGGTSARTAVNISVARFSRIKVEVAMSEFTTEQQVAYVGEDGAFKQDAFSATDFALVGKISVKAGTGTGLPPDQKVQYLGTLKAEGFLAPDEAADAARSSFSRVLGISPNSHEQYIERCIEAWTDGPPDVQGAPDPVTGQPSDWTTQYKAWLQGEQQFEQAQQAFQQQTQLFQQGVELRATQAAGPPQVGVGPEAQSAQAGDAFARAGILLQSQPYPSAPPPPPPPNQVPKPWTPFMPRPNDTEPFIAGIWMRKISNVMSTVEYTRFGPEWKDVLDRQYTTTRQAVAVAGGQVAPGQPSATKPTAPTQPQHASPTTGPAR